MNNENMISLFPQQRIKAYDGLPVTADLWEQAHTYHRLASQSHNLFFHGAGILSGLEVVASDPADSIIFVTPGIAVDASGQLIVLSEPVAYDLGSEVDGPLFLVISHRESSPGVEKSIKKGLPLVVNDEFLLIARSDIPQGKWVELARFNRENRSVAIKDAGFNQQPQKNEIDLRYRRTIKIQTERMVTAAAAYLGDVKQKVHGSGLSNLASELQISRNIKLVVQDHMQVTPDLLQYDLVYLVGEGAFALDKNQLNGLKGYIEQGGVVMLEACDPEAASHFEEIIEAVGVPVEPVARGHVLLKDPYHFAVLPSGYFEKGEVKAGEGLFFSTYNYGRLWNGEMEGRSPLRHEIRTGMEWGANLVTYVLERLEQIG